MVYMNTYNFRASELGAKHTFLLVRIISENVDTCRVYSFDLGRHPIDTCSILAYLCDNNCEDILDDIVKCEKFYINGSEMKLCNEYPKIVFIHKGIQYRVIS